MKIPKTGSSPKQKAYALRSWGAQGQDKKNIALDVGYAPSVANSVISKIESKRGYNNAIAKLAAESNNMALAVLFEFKARGLKDFENKDLIGALNAIGNAWSKFNVVAKEGGGDNGKNKLRTIIMQQVENQTFMPTEKVIDQIIEEDEI